MSSFMPIGLIGKGAATAFAKASVAKTLIAAVATGGVALPVAITVAWGVCKVISHETKSD